MPQAHRKAQYLLALERLGLHPVPGLSCICLKQIGKAQLHHTGISRITDPIVVSVFEILIPLWYQYLKYFNHCGISILNSVFQILIPLWYEYLKYWYHCGISIWNTNTTMVSLFQILIPLWYQYLNINNKSSTSQKMFYEDSCVVLCPIWCECRCICWKDHLLGCRPSLLRAGSFDVKNI